jgi:hypothetical protein
MKTCLICDSAEKVEVHHLDFDHGNDLRGNRVQLCQRCHKVIHQSGGLSREEMISLRYAIKVCHCFVESKRGRIP